MNVVSHAAQPREAWWSGVTTRMHVSARNGATQLCIFEQWVEPEAGAPTHRHPAEEVLAVLAGEAGIWIDGEYAVLGSGQSLIIPAGRKHGFRNVGSELLHLHAVIASSTFEAMFEGSDAPVQRWLAPQASSS